MPTANSENLVVTLLLFPGVGSIVLGLLYIVSIFGPTEAEVRFWGFVAVIIGFAALILEATVVGKPHWLAKLALILGYLGIALLQVLPIMLWVDFHGYGISDGTPPSAFIAHWCFATPHMVVFVSGFLAAYITVRFP